MSTAILFSVVVIFVGTCLVLGLRGFVRPLESLEEFSDRLVPVNIEAIKNLLDPEQDRYLEQRLNARDLRSVRRERALVTADYVRMIAANAAVLVRAGQLAATSKDAELAATGKRLGMDALNTRVTALRALALLYWEALFPGRPRPLDALRRYTGLDTDVYVLKGRTKAEKRA